MSTATLEKPRRKQQPEASSEVVSQPAAADPGRIGLQCYYWQPQGSGMQAFPAQIIERALTGGWQANIHYFGGRVRRASNSRFNDVPKRRMLTLDLPEGYTGGIYGAVKAEEKPAPEVVEVPEPKIATKTLGILPPNAPAKPGQLGVGPRINE